MIRPFTCLCMLVAAGSGLYLYQEKHRAEMLDRQIAKVVRATDAAHERTGMLRAEWTLLNQPDRLEDLSAKYLQLQPMAPGQFVQLAGLDAKLPAVALPPPPAPDPVPAPVPMASATPATPTAVASATPARRAGPPATADLGAVRVADLAQSSVAQSSVAPSSVTPPPVTASSVMPAAGPSAPILKAAAVAPRAAATREIAHAEPAARSRKAAPQIANAASFQSGPSAEPRPLGTRQIMAPVVDAFATPHPMQVNRPATLQRTEAISRVISSGMATAGSVLGGSALGGSALGGGRPMLAAPVPISQ